MRIGIHAWGTAGDIHPLLALAGGLARAGHEVRLAHSSVDGTDHTASLADIDYEQRLILSPQAAAERHRISEEMLADASPRRQFERAIRELLEPVIDPLTRSAAELAKWADVVVSNAFAHPLSAAAEAQRKPFVCVYIGASVPTREFPPAGLPHLGPLNLLLWKLSGALLSAAMIGSVNRVRVRLGLAPIKRAQQQLYGSALDLVAISPTLLPRPSDWPDKVHLPGFLNLPPLSRPEKLEPDLREFLARGPAPVYVSFEDMSSVERNPHTLIELTVDALAAAGCRAIVQSSLPTSAAPNVFPVSALAQEQVLPRCSAMIHHGGAETTQAALRFGLPSVVIAHLPANFQWGRRLYQLGVAPRHLNRAEVDKKHLTRTIEKVLRNPAMRATAERLSGNMREEDGVRRAVDLIAGIGTRWKSPGADH